MSDTEIVLVPGRDGDENGNGWRASLVLDHDTKLRQLYVIVMDEMMGMAEGVDDEVYEALRLRFEATANLAASVRAFLEALSYTAPEAVAFQASVRLGEPLADYLEAIK